MVVKNSLKNHECLKTLSLKRMDKKQNQYDFCAKSGKICVVTIKVATCSVASRGKHDS